MRYSNDRTTRASLGGGEYLTVVQPQAAAAVMNYHTGELVAIVGGREEPVQKLQFNRAYQNNMPVGSSIKPLSVYGPAFDLGNSPGTPVLNLPIPILNWQSENGYPNNYGGGDFTGAETHALRHEPLAQHGGGAGADDLCGHRKLAWPTFCGWAWIPTTSTPTAPAWRWAVPRSR